MSTSKALENIARFCGVKAARTFAQASMEVTQATIVLMQQRPSSRVLGAHFELAHLQDAQRQRSQFLAKISKRRSTNKNNNLQLPI